MNFDLSNKRALVGGSSQGIGLAAAIELSRLGADVTLLSRTEDSLKSALKKLDVSKGQKHDYIVADYGDPLNLKKKTEQSIQKKGIIHVLVNNTGGPPGGSITNARAEEFLVAFTNHLVCSHILAQAVLEGMKEENFGRIINVISTSVKQPLKGLGVSNTVRAAVANWSKTFSIELAPFGITVNNVLPGATNTARLTNLIEARSQKTGISAGEIRKEMMHEIPAGRFAEPSEVANAIAFLATPAAAYINGINLPVDGGRTGCL